MNDSSWFVTEHPISAIVWVTGTIYVVGAVLFGLT